MFEFPSEGTEREGEKRGEAEIRVCGSKRMCVRIRGGRGRGGGERGEG